MTEDCVKRCLNMLSGMLSPKQEWTKAVAGIYAIGLRDWDDQIAVAAIEACLFDDYRPSLKRLREAACHLAAPLPDIATMRAEIRSLMIRYPAADRAIAPHSHKLVAVIADELGGWKSLSRLTTEQIDAAFPAAYERATRDFHEGIAETLLRLPEAERALLIAAPKRTLDEQRRLGQTIHLDRKKIPGDDLKNITPQRHTGTLAAITGREDVPKEKL